MEDYFKQITIEINSYLEQIFYLRIDLNINEIEIYYLNKENLFQWQLVGKKDLIENAVWVIWDVETNQVWFKIALMES